MLRCFTLQCSCSIATFVLIHLPTIGVQGGSKPGTNVYELFLHCKRINSWPVDSSFISGQVSFLVCESGLNRISFFFFTCSACLPSWLLHCELSNMEMRGVHLSPEGHFSYYKSKLFKHGASRGTVEEKLLWTCFHRSAVKIYAVRVIIQPSFRFTVSSPPWTTKLYLRSVKTL